MKLIVDASKPKKLGYQHKSQQKGWTDSSSRVGYNRGQLQDEDYFFTLNTFNPLWRYIIQRLPKEDQSPLVVLGYDSIPFAIELSQWTYPVTYITDTWEGVKKAQRDCDIQAGFFKQFLYFDFIKNCPPSRAVLFIGILEHLTDHQCEEFLGMLLRRTRQIICAVSVNRNWKKLLDGKYDYDMIKYCKEGYYLLTIHAKKCN